MKAHIGVDATSGHVHTVIAEAANVHDITEATALLHGHEMVMYACLASSRHCQRIASV
ncbi:transposase [Paraburkholderia sp. JPY169]|uniref:Transposase n=1 Tax=Paraburkholderia youngii TaxID=2782701 RepID=A0A7Y6K6Z9_9BURK|nr:transposase [Paraburkholderia youngii]